MIFIIIFTIYFYYQGINTHPRCVCPNFGSFESQKPCNRTAASAHLYHKDILCVSDISNLHTNICHQLVRAISYWQNAFQRVLLPATETAKMDSALTLAIAERGHRCWAESITCRSNWIRCGKTRATYDLEMLCWWVSTQTHGPGKAMSMSSPLVPWAW